VSERLRVRELMQERAGLVHEARGILDAADADERGLSEEENTRYDALMDRVTAMAEDIQRREQQIRLEDGLGSR